jgi:signal peptidase I
MTKKEEKKGRILLWLERKIEKSKLSRKQQQKFLFTADILINLIIIVAIVMFIRTFIMSPFQVYGVSMCNTFNYSSGNCHDSYGDYIIINKSSYLKLPGFSFGEPERGDVIVFRPPQNNGEFYIKRVIGLPGETVKLIDGYVYVYNDQHPEGVKLNETYLSEENQGKTYAIGEISNFEIPADKYFVLGDNRQKSSDSRLCFKESAGAPGCENPNITPYLKLDEIEGKASIVVWPLPHLVASHKYNELN